MKSFKFVGLPGCMMFVIMAAIFTIITKYIAFWLFGVWIPWFVAVFSVFISPVILPMWFILWLLHYTPVHFPLFVR